MTKKGSQDSMNIFLDIVTNPVLFIPAISWVIAQIMKAIINAIVNKKFSVDRLVGDGGMPSGHSATVTSLAIMCGLTSGFDSTVFGLATIFAIVVMHDALGVRREAGKHAISIIEMAEILNDYLSEHNENRHKKKRLYRGGTGEKGLHSRISVKTVAQKAEDAHSRQNLKHRLMCQGRQEGGRCVYIRLKGIEAAAEHGIIKETLKCRLPQGKSAVVREAS